MVQWYNKQISIYFVYFIASSRMRSTCVCKWPIIYVFNRKIRVPAQHDLHTDHQQENYKKTTFCLLRFRSFSHY